MSNDEKKKAQINTPSKQRLNESKTIRYAYLPALEEMRHDQSKKSYNAKQVDQLLQSSDQTHPTKKDGE